MSWMSWNFKWKHFELDRFFLNAMFPLNICIKLKWKLFFSFRDRFYFHNFCFESLKINEIPECHEANICFFSSVKEFLNDKTETKVSCACLCLLCFALLCVAVLFCDHRALVFIFAKFNSNSFCVTLGDKNDKNTCFVKTKIYYLCHRICTNLSEGCNSIQIRQ